MPTKMRSRSTASARIKKAEKKTGGQRSSDQTLRSLLEIKLRSLYDVEQQIVKALPKLVKKADDKELSEAMNHHLRQTEEHVKRLEQIFGILEIKPQKINVSAIRGLADDADWVVKNVKGASALDAALIAALRYVEHYEIAGYGAAREWADLLSETEISDLLEETLHEEEEASDTLTDLALSRINIRAAGEESNVDWNTKNESAEKDLHAASTGGGLLIFEEDVSAPAAGNKEEESAEDKDEEEEDDEGEEEKEADDES